MPPQESGQDGERFNDCLHGKGLKGYFKREEKRGGWKASRKTQKRKYTVYSYREQIVYFEYIFSYSIFI